MRELSFPSIVNLEKILLQPKKEFRQIYEESGIPILFNEYIRRMFFYLSRIFAITTVCAFLVHIFLLRVSWYRIFPAAISISFAVSNFVGLIFLYYPIYRRNQNRAKIVNGLVYIISYMAILSASGLSIEHILERILEMDENPPFKQLAKKFMMNIKLFGFEVSSALIDISLRSPSEILKKLFVSISNNIKTSGDLKSLLNFEMKSHLQMKRESLKKRMGALAYMGEIYVAVIVVAPILFILMITILSILGGGSPTNSSIPQLNLIVFFGIPILATGFIILLDTIIRGEE